MTELEKLQAELAELKKAAKQNKAETYVKIVTAVATCLAILVGVAQYFITSRTEFRKTFWQKQLEVYTRATDAAARIALSSDVRSSAADRATFWRLYWGELSMLEHPNVKAAMVAYGRQLNAVEEGKMSPADLKLLSYNLARQCRISLKTTWNPADLEDIPDVVPVK